MALSKEQKDQLKELQRLEKEPATPAGNVNFSLDLSNDAAWERARKLGLIPGDDDNGSDDDDDDEADDAPKRQGRGERFFGGGQ